MQLLRREKIESCFIIICDGYFIVKLECRYVNKKKLLQWLCYEEEVAVMFGVIVEVSDYQSNVLDDLDDDALFTSGN